ncbi:hypothetical protein [Thalassotalea sp. PLHSN55]|uniref:hypothetical protein n=1 Tax=Thalassotalea sp. PLHSN55 TaxID=3435888 RepID=UPI003F86E62C
MNSLPRFFITLLFTVSFCCYSKTIIEINASNFTENYSQSVDVSGSVLASSYVDGNSKFVEPNGLHIFVPNPTPTVHIILASIDGKYTAETQINLKSEQVGWIQIKLPSSYTTEIKKYKANQLVAFAYTDSEDMFGDYVQEVFPTSWGQPTGSSLQFFINSAGRSPNITFKNTSGAVINNQCTRIQASLTRVFNHLCSIKKHSLDKQATVTFSPDKKSAGKDYVIWNINDT